VLAGTLMRHADIAMYRAKRTRPGWAEYESGRDGAAEVRLHELNDLDQALADDEPAPVYQPIVPRSGR
jgi:GGDEF domain-containing protein